MYLKILTTNTNTQVGIDPSNLLVDRSTTCDTARLDVNQNFSLKFLI